MGFCDPLKIESLKLGIIILGILLIGCNSEEAQPSSRKTNQEITTNNRNTNKNIEFQNGDLIFHTSRSSQSEAIQLATNSKYSHMGIIYQNGNDFFVYEAVQSVKITELKEWIDRGQNGEFVVKRLKNSEDILTEEGLQKMKSVGEKYLGKEYDYLFEWSDDKIYCSELVWKIYKESFDIEIGELERFGDFNLSDKIVQRKVKERYGNEVPEEELVITPDRMFHSDKLITIIE